MTDFRALCAELADAYLRLLEYINNSTWLGYEPSDDPLLLRARTALADGPAVPDGREPASVVSEPTYDDLSELCSQHGLDVDSWPLEKFDALWETARAVLARWGNPAPQPPAEGEVAELVAWLRDDVDLSPADKRRAADLLEQRHPTPVPVAERLPGPEDCDEDGRCWWWRTDDADEWWELLCISDAREYNAGCGNARYTHWLPFTALPLPSGEVE